MNTVFVLIIGFLSMWRLSYWPCIMIDDGGIMMANDYFEWKIKCKNSCYVPSTMEVRKTKAWPKFTEKSGKYWRQCEVGTNISKTSDRPIRYPAYKSSSPQADRPDGKTYIWEHYKLHIHLLWPFQTNALCRECVCKSFINNLPPSAKTLEDFSGRNWKWSKFRRN